MRALHQKAMFVSGTAEVSVYVRDPKDYMILSAAAEAEAHVLVSSDQDLLVLGFYEGTAILTPRQFVTWLDGIGPEEP